MEVNFVMEVSSLSTTPTIVEASQEAQNFAMEDARSIHPLPVVLASPSIVVLLL